MLWVVSSIVLVIAIINLIGFIMSAPRYQGPVSDHFNGKTFENIGDVQAKGGKDLLKWMMNREKQSWTQERKARFGPEPPKKVKNGAQITFVNHSTFLIQMNGLNILTDPIWSERTSPVSFAGPKRMRPPGIKFEELPTIDLVLISHNHYDHLDVPTIKDLIKKYDPHFITPLGVAAFIKNQGSENVRDLDWWDEYQFKQELNIACVPAQHFSGRGIFDRDATLWCGYILRSQAGDIYFAGDTGYGELFKSIRDKYPEIKLSLLPIGAYLPKWFMSPIHISPEEAVKAHQDVGSKVSIGMHFGTFPLADDGPEQARADLRKALNDRQIEDGSFLVLEEGESFVLVNE
jgi:L-ascorbate metabolism protein UlaG (beta-lactamase superfamily)